MLAQSSSKVHYQTESHTTFINALKSLNFFQMLKYCGFTKLRGISPKDILIGLLMQIFAFDTVNHRMTSSRGRDSAGHCDNVVYDFLRRPTLNWLKLCTKLAAAIIGRMDKLNLRNKDKRCFIIDDTVIERPRARRVELLCHLFDHVFQRHVKGFTNLMLAWTDGISTVPVNYIVVSSSRDEKLICPANDSIDGRTVGAARRAQARQNKNKSAVDLLKYALSQGIDAGYVLMDTWFTHEPLIKQIMELDLAVIGMLRKGRELYSFGGALKTTADIFRLMPVKRSGDIIGSVMVETRRFHIPVKIVFIRHRKNHGEILQILSTDTTLSDQDIVALYTRRFNIEGCFHTMKHYLHLNRENMGRSFDATLAFTALSLIRTMTLEWIRRGSGEVKTAGGLFRDFQEEMFETPFAEALCFMMDALSKILPETLRKEGLSEKQIERVMDTFMTKLYAGLQQVKYVKSFIDEYKRAANTGVPDKPKPMGRSRAKLAA